MMGEGMKQKQKLEVLEARITEFTEMLNSFISSKESEENVIFLVA